MKKFLRKQNGITLIALVITIIVLLILAGVAISMISGDNGILNQAANARTRTEEGAQNEASTLNDIEALINEYTGGKTEGVTNPYDPDGWDIAYTCTDGTWSDKIEKGNEATGDIVAKLYGMGEIETIPTYSIVIEGSGDMGDLLSQNTGEIYGWLSSTVNGEIYITEAIVCDGVTNIGVYAFGMSTNLTTTKISTSVTTIGEGAFAACGNLISIKLPGVTAIENNAFGECTNLASIKMPNVTDIGNRAFKNCVALTTIELPSVINIGQYAFSQCEGLTTVKFSTSVKNIRYYAFLNCPNITDIYYEGTEDEWNTISIDVEGNDYLTGATIHYNS